MKTLYIIINYDTRRAISIQRKASNGASETQTLWQDNEQIWTYNGRTNFINMKQIYNKKFFTFANIYAHILFKKGLI